MSQKKLRKYLEYALSKRAFEQRPSEGQISAHVLKAAAAIRGPDRPPAILIHGIMERSGTVYTGRLLGLHPDIYRYPLEVWEAPFLSLSGGILDLQEVFFRAHKHNRGKIGEADFLPLFGAAFIAYLYQQVPPGKRMLLKIPSVQYLHFFFSVFPYENLLLLVRDGRDVVASTLKTWPRFRWMFSDVCRRWARSAETVLAFERQHAGRAGYWLAKFEDAVRDPETFVREACSRFALDADIYPFDKIETLPVIGSSTTSQQGYVQMEQPAQFNPIGRWREWSAWRKWRFQHIAGRPLRELGYT
jgi:hypothetical protein